MNTKTVNLKTNYNNKLAADCFVHIDLDPLVSITETMINETLFVVACMDGSFPPVRARIEDILKFDLKDAVSCITLTSHGMNSDEFRKWMKEKNPKLTDESKLIAYFYKKVND